MPYIGNKTSKFKTADELTVTGDATVTGSVDATSYTGDGSSLTGISSDLVDDTTPQLGGDLDTNSNDVNFGDNDKAQFGAGNDLQIYHDGTDSYIRDNGTGDLYIEGADDIRFRTTSGETYAVMNENSSVNLYFDDSLKFVTSSTGVDVTGTVTADGVSLDDNQKALFGTGDDLEIYHNGTNSLIINNTGTLNIRNLADDKDILLQTDDGSGGYNTYLHADGSDEKIKLYYGNSAKFQTTSNGVETVGGTDVSMSASGDGQLKIDGNGYTGAIALNGSNMHIYTNSSSRGLVFGTNETQRMRISGGGDVLSKAEGGSGEFSMRQGSSKIWTNFNGSGTPSARDSYNLSSFVDNGTGKYTLNINNDMNNASYAPTGSYAEDNTHGGSGSKHNGRFINGLAAGSYKMAPRSDDASSSLFDAQYIFTSAHGDLA